MGASRRFKLYDITALRGKVPSVLLDIYLEDPQNMEMISFIGGLHRSCGSFDISVRISEDIAEKANLSKEDIKETSIGVWNLYVLSKTYIEQEKFNKAYRALDIAERYWSKDLILADNTGISKIPYIEDLWLRRAFGYLIQGRKSEFEKIIDKVMTSRYELYEKAYPATGETPIRDVYLLDCFEYSSYMCRNTEDIKHAVVFIKTALRYLSRIPITNDYLEGKKCEKSGDYKNAYTYYLKFYLENRPTLSGESIAYGTCKSCAYFKTFDNVEGECQKNNIKVDQHKACSKYVALPLSELQ
ncbi:hypothetical protein OXPF_05150 [Oxobacter pfennigii]|uniref:Tetratricopeptide repeat protein n=1 Tax=Oxobacter pfennigii TaxID=36849 RepID=A0A0P8WE86_9CLOT|nr:hypothetical protein [Oxobacter pfennigii]KPU46034.1 hypothetical protein OXPF_05150 [Oxobacter pfennigii]